MTTDLDGALRSTGADLHLSRPVTDVLARGDRLRHRRYTVRTGTAAVCLAVAGGAASGRRPVGLVLDEGDGSSRHHDPRRRHRTRAGESRRLTSSPLPTRPVAP